MKMTKEEYQRVMQKVRERIDDAQKNGSDFVIPGDPWENHLLTKILKGQVKFSRVRMKPIIFIYSSPAPPSPPPPSPRQPYSQNYSSHK